MNISTVGQALAMGDGTAPEGITGTIVKLDDHKIHQGSGGNFSMQKGVLQDWNSGATIEIVFHDREELQKHMLLNSVITVTAAAGSKGPRGLKRQSNEWRGQVTPQLWVYDAASINVDAAAAAQQQQAPPQAAAQPPQQPAAPPQHVAATQQQPAPPQQPAVHAAAPKVVNGQALSDEQLNTNLRHVKAKMMQSANLYGIALDVADYIRDQYQSEHGAGTFLESQHQACVASIFIQGCHGSLYDFLPKSPLKKGDQ